MQINSFPIARYQLQFQVVEPFCLPEYAGSALRGVFGRSLRKISCMTKQESCQDCWLYQTCPYTNIFATPAPEQHQIQKFSAVPNGYMIEPLEWGSKHYQAGELFCFNLVLFGRLIQQLPLIVFAFQRGLALNLARGKLTLTDIFLFAENGLGKYAIFQEGKIMEHSTTVTIPDNLPSELNLSLISPLRLQENGKPLGVDHITAQRFLLSLAKRIALLSEFHAQPIDLNFEQLVADIADIDGEKSLRWQDWQRYSSRQKQTMKLGGVLGNWHFQGLSQNWAKLIYLGQWLHNGKNATFGLGQYQITNL